MLLVLLLLPELNIASAMSATSGKESSLGAADGPAVPGVKSIDIHGATPAWSCDVEAWGSGGCLG